MLKIAGGVVIGGLILAALYIIVPTAFDVFSEMDKFGRAGPTILAARVCDRDGQASAECEKAQALLLHGDMTSPETADYRQLWALAN